MMFRIFEYKYIKELFQLALPIIMGNLGLILLGAGDCFVAGRYSTEAIASISIATSINATVMMLGIGLMFSVSPLLSNKRGAKESTKKYFYPSIKFAVISGLILMLVTFAYIPLLDLIGLERQLLYNVKIFTFIVALSSVPAQINVTIKEFLQSYEIVFIPNILLIISVFFNIFLNYIFVFGMFGLPQMGVAGIAVSTTIVRTTLSIILLTFCLVNFKFKKYKDSEYYKQILKIGLPISSAIIIEFLAFNYIAVLLGKVSGIYAAAHNVILVLSSTSFMIPMGISNAMAVKVGVANGAKNYEELIKYIKNGTGVASLFMLLAGIVFAIFPEKLASLFTQDKELLAVIIPVMYIVAAFQVTDGLQVSLSGIYKGLKKTKFVMLSNCIGYLIIGVTLGFYLGIVRKMYLTGCWLAISISSVILCFILMFFLIFILKRLKKEYAGELYKLHKGENLL